MTATLDQPMAKTGGTSAPKGVTLRDMLEKRRDLIASVLPKHMTPERLIKLASVAVARVPKLGECSALSVVNAVIKSAELGLDCSGTLGSAYLVPYGKECTLIIGYRGLIDLARRSGQIVSIEARVVWQNDTFDFEYGLEPKLLHKPTIDKEPGEFRLVYGMAKLRDGAIQVEVMTKAQIDAIKQRSRAGNSGPWVTDYPEMARKTVVKRLSKYLPMSVEFQEAIAEDADAEFVEGSVVESKTDVLNARLKQQAAAQGEIDLSGLAEDVESVGDGQPVAKSEAAASTVAKPPLDNATALEVLKSKSPSARDTATETKPPQNLPAANEAIEDGTEADAVWNDAAKAEKRCREQARDLSQIARSDFNAAISRHAVSLGHGPMPAKLKPEQWQNVYAAITAKRFNFSTGLVE